MHRKSTSLRAAVMVSVGLAGCQLLGLQTGEPMDAAEGSSSGGTQSSSTGGASSASSTAGASSGSSSASAGSSSNAASGSSSSSASAAGGASSASNGSSSSSSSSSSSAAASAGGTLPGGAFACDPVPHGPEATLRRLTLTQYHNVLRDLGLLALGTQGRADQFFTDISWRIDDILPPEVRELVSVDPHPTFRRLDQSLQQAHAESFYESSLVVADQLLRSDRWGFTVGTCATDSNTANDAQCLTDFLNRLGSRMYRRPLTAEDIAFYESAYGADKTADRNNYINVMVLLLNAPHFLYHVEHGTTEVAGNAGVYDLSAFEVAARISFQIWDSLPDDTLWQTAVDGTLLNAPVFAAQVDRMLNDPRAQATADAFFDDWLKLEEVPDYWLQNYDELYTAFTAANVPSRDLRDEVRQDVLDMMRYYTWTTNGTVDAALRSELNFARGTELADLYGVAPWDGASPPASFPSGERPGLITRAAFVSAAGPSTHPILKGVFIRKYLLCDQLDPPPNNANATPPDLRPNMTTRDVVSEITEQPGTVCAGCHAERINPLGFATENYDSLGRFRLDQRMFDDNANEIGVLPVDTSSVPQVIAGDTAFSDGPQDVTRLVAESSKVQSCMARNLFRFTHQRWENTAGTVDGCSLEALRAAALTGSIKDMFRAAAMDPALRRRVFQ